ncbi:MAG: NADH:ubiquinone reductase (Na(+)-transporting) subunit C [Bacteroidia bacterium]|nr:NADH:ubiquinone reductase (Na(+)-transporting) subunit C [Bacteroidia bacterium]
MNKDGDRFTFGFAIAMVVIVATLSSVAAISLKPFQDENIKQEKMQNILKTIRVDCTREEALVKFEEFVKQRLILNYQAEVISEKKGIIDEKDKSDAFNIDIKKEFKSSMTIEERNYPMFICEKSGKTYYVIPMVGKGLWGPVWGYIALGEDYNTVYGASFDHKTETPGLGAEIRYELFQKQFVGDQILDKSGNFVSIKVLKGGAAPDDLHGVDGITGGTITSNGVTEMLKRTLNIYVPYFKKSQIN